MNEINEHATCREFGKMLRLIADLYIQMGNRPLAEEMMEYTYITDRIGFITTKHAYDDHIRPLKDAWVFYGFDVDEAKAWGDHVLISRANGAEPDYDSWLRERENQKAKGYGR